MRLRDYQESLKNDTYREIRSGNKRVLMQLPTGGGKTRIFCSIIKDALSKDGRVFVLAHRIELLGQIKETLACYDINAGIIKAGVPRSASTVQVASVQTLARRLEKFKNYPPRLIVIDEAHHSPAAQYLKIIEAFPSAIVLGVTATPCRIDGKGLGDVFESMVCGPQIHELVSSGFLVPPTYYASRSVIDGQSVKKSAGDYNLRQLSEAVSETRLEGDLVSEWQDKASGQQTIVFAVNVNHSQKIVEAYENRGISAAHLDCKSLPDERRDILARFGSGEIKILSNVGIVTEGFDVPACGCVQLARPTQSLSLYLQMIGRALRTAPGKSEAIVLDHAGALLFHGHVLTPMNWSLSQTKPKEVKADWGEEREPRQPKKKIVTHDGKEVLLKVEYDISEAWQKELERLTRLSQEKDYKAGWIAHRMRERFAVMTLDQLKVLGKVCGYHWKWATRQFEIQSKQEAA